MLNCDKRLKICAFCPNPCRSAIPMDHESPKESQLPSAIALLSCYVATGKIKASDEVVVALTDLDTVRICQERCVYGHDIVQAVNGVLETVNTKENQLGAAF